MVSRVGLRKSWVIKTKHNVGFGPFLLVDYAVGTRLHPSTVGYRSWFLSSSVCIYTLLSRVSTELTLEIGGHLRYGF